MQRQYGLRLCGGVCAQITLSLILFHQGFLFVAARTGGIIFTSEIINYPLQAIIRTLK
jgi:hypothetical protein